ncbi:hypothetical protein K7X08_026606 [Anisodus acutangulus]|uniref:Uncharacterized protein n=1 Tax=Anisodus acutangulus TaxID=402998 RepID=A0A9Q1LAT7_9SOLA|nr:hypothetical protein K7X08_026606 [Anisodus acutangulus]
MRWRKFWKILNSEESTNSSSPDNGDHGEELAEKEKQMAIIESHVESDTLENQEEPKLEDTNTLEKPTEEVIGVAVSQNQEQMREPEVAITTGLEEPTAQNALSTSRDEEVSSKQKIVIKSRKQGGNDTNVPQPSRDIKNGRSYILCSNSLLVASLG